MNVKNIFLGGLIISLMVQVSFQNAAAKVPRYLDELDAKENHADPEFIAFAKRLGLPVTESGLYKMYLESAAQKQPDTEPVFIERAQFEGWNAHRNDGVTLCQPRMLTQKTGSSCAYNALFNGTTLYAMLRQGSVTRAPFFDQARMKELFGMRPVGIWRTFVKGRDPHAGSGEDVEAQYLEELVEHFFPELKDQYAMIDGSGLFMDTRHSVQNEGEERDAAWDHIHRVLEQRPGHPYLIFMNNSSQYVALSVQEAAHWVAVVVVQDPATKKMNYFVLNSFFNHILDKSYTVGLVRSIQEGRYAFDHAAAVLDAPAAAARPTLENKPAAGSLGLESNPEIINPAKKAPEGYVEYLSSQLSGVASEARTLFDSTVKALDQRLRGPQVPALVKPISNASVLQPVIAQGNQVPAAQVTTALPVSVPVKPMSGAKTPTNAPAIVAQPAMNPVAKSQVVSATPAAVTPQTLRPSVAQIPIRSQSAAQFAGQAALLRQASGKPAIAHRKLINTQSAPLPAGPTGSNKSAPVITSLAQDVLLRREARRAQEREQKDVQSVARALAMEEARRIEHEQRDIQLALKLSREEERKAVQDRSMHEERKAQDEALHERIMNIVHVVTVARGAGLSYADIIAQFVDDQFDDDQRTVIAMLCAQGDIRSGLYNSFSDDQRTLADQVLSFLE